MRGFAIAGRPVQAARAAVHVAIAYSIVVPLFDCRDAGTRALQSALDQTFSRTRYEVVAVVDACADSRAMQPLLMRCDRVVAVDADFGCVETEIALFDAGRRVARGDFLFFIEGHTVLETDALRAIDDALVGNPGCELACGGRSNHAKTRLGMLIGSNNDLHEARAEQRGNFTLGANCVIRRSLLESLGGFVTAFQRFNETVVYDRAREAGVRIGTIGATLCTHHNDTGLRWLVRLLVATGRAKARYYATLPRKVRAARARHPAYRWLSSRPLAMAFALPLRVAGPLTIVVAIALARRWFAAAAAVYRIGVGLTDLSGACLECAKGGCAAARRRDIDAMRNFAAPGTGPSVLDVMKRTA